MNREFQRGEKDAAESTKLAQLVRHLNTSGHNPATSGNYSLRSVTSPGLCLMSESGIDKGLFTESNLLPVQIDTGKLHSSLASSGKRSSAETEVHVAIYQSTSAGCVLHSHLLEAILFADLFPGESTLYLEGLELLKGFRGVTTHLTKIAVPCFENTQDMGALSKEIGKSLTKTKPAFGILLRHHGLYVWGDSVEEAKRHLEVFEYVFKYYLRSRGNGR
jgi:methylthioribulose-1-phosphate dehydratase